MDSGVVQNKDVVLYEVMVFYQNHEKLEKVHGRVGIFVDLTPPIDDLEEELNEVLKLLLSNEKRRRSWLSGFGNYAIAGCKKLARARPSMTRSWPSQRSSVSAPFSA